MRCYANLRAAQGIVLLGLYAAMGCGGPSTSQRSGSRLPSEATDPSQVPELDRPLTAAGARCQGGTCACRPIDGYGRGLDADREDPPPADGRKRFELRTGRGDDIIKLTVEGVGTFVKDTPSPEPACVYIDLPPGAHRLRYHVTARDPGRGIEPRLRISEYSPSFGKWYRTFAYRCAGSDGPCTAPDARDALDALSKVPRGLHDPCGSTRIQGLRFSSDRAADVHLGDFNLQLVLNVYKFTPRFPPDAPSCTGTSVTTGEAR